MLPKTTTDLSLRFFENQSLVCAELGSKDLDLLKVEMAESGVWARARNVATNASGLIQFMPKTLEGLGYLHGHEQFRLLPAELQVPWVRRYFAPHRGKLDTPERIYVAVFLPALLGIATSPDVVLAAKNGRLGHVYAANSVFDADNDYVITVGELGAAIRRNMVGPRWEEVFWRATGKQAPANDVGMDLTVTLGQQRALARLGYDPGPLDGLPGPQTTSALVAFQASVGVKADGILGPMTKDALRLKLRAA